MQSGKLNVFRASAGSGKTFELTAQYISLLLAYDMVQPRSILAVTFTIKATHEMKTRILEHLYDIAHHDTTTKPDGFLSKVMEETRQPVEVLKRRAAVALHTILHAYDDFYVQTIDSFLQRLLRGLAHELGLTANFQVDIEDKDIFNRAVDRLMMELPKRKELLNWMTRFAIDNMEEEGNWNVIAKVKELATEINKEAFAKESDSLAGKLNNQLMRDYQSRLRAMLNNAVERLENKAHAFQEAYGDGHQISNGSTILSYIQKALKCETIKEHGPRMQGFFADAQNWLRKADRNNAQLVSEVTLLREKLVDLESTRVESLNVINSCSLSLKQLGELRLVGEINQMVTDIGEETGRFLLGRTPLLFDRLVSDDDTSFVYERAGVQFQHVMIDEFQDTSTLQWHTFKRLINECLANGKSSMLVGDVKQSIYRWRGGDWENLAHIDQQFKKEQLATNTLQTNYRSDRNIVEFNNELFSKAIKHKLFVDENNTSDQADLERIYSDVEQRVASGKGEGYVRVSIGGGKDVEAWCGLSEEDAVANGMLEDLALQIYRLHEEKGVAYRDMAVLVRGRTDGRKVINYMTEYHADLPFISNDAFQLDSSPAVQMIIATLRYLLHPQDTVSQVYLLHRYYQLVKREDKTWEEIIGQRDDLMPEEISSQRSALLRMPLYERCERIIALLNLGCIEGQQDYIFFFLDRLKDFLLSEGGDVHQFLQFWDEKLASKAIGSAVFDGIQIVTIHSAKGLAYHTVFMPYLAWELCGDSTYTKKKQMWCKPGEAPYSDIPLLPMKLKKSMAESIYKEAYESERYRQRVENLNLLYVAFTRAEHNLFVWLDTKAFGFKSSVGELVRQALMQLGEEAPCLIERGEPTGYVDKVVAAVEEVRNPMRVVPEVKIVALPKTQWRAEFRQSTAATMFVQEPNEKEALQRAYIERGKLLHHIFEQIAVADDAPKAVRAAVQQGVLPAEEVDEVMQLVSHRILTGRAAHWFNHSWELFRECTILTRTKDGRIMHRRPDRVMMSEKETIVVDYKFGKPKAEYIDQVKEYMDLLQKMGHNNVKGYVWYVLQNTYEEVV